MEFEQYLERDILAFLDRKTEHKNTSDIDREEEYGLYLTKDYLKELNYALDSDELTKAKKLFDELKLTYSKLPKKSIERKKIYSLLEKMYEKIQDYVKIKEGKIEIIREGNSEIFKDKTDKFTEIGPRKEDAQIVTTDDDMSSYKKTEMPISFNGKKTTTTKSKKESENTDTDETSSEELNTKSIIKDDKKGKYYEEKSDTKEEQEIRTQNIYVKKDIEDKKEKISKEKNEIVKEEEYIKPNVSAENETNKHRYEEEKEYAKLKRRVITDIEYANTDSADIDYLENEIIESTVHLEQLKTKIIEKLVDKLHQKMEEKNREQDRKIETLKKEMVESIINELNKRFKEEKEESTHNIEQLKGEILNQVYRHAKNIVTTEDNSIVTNKSQNITAEKYSIIEDNLKKDNTTQNNSIHNITSPSAKTAFTGVQRQITKIFRAISENDTKTKKDSTDPNQNKKIQRKISPNESDNTIEYITPENTKEKEISIKDTIQMEYSTINSNKQKITKPVEDTIKEVDKISEQKIQQKYEHAIYHMLNKNYENAAKLFTEILIINPKNKAASIRLQECIEKSPELKNTNLIETQPVNSNIMEKNSKINNNIETEITQQVLHEVKIEEENKTNNETRYDFTATKNDSEKINQSNTYTVPQYTSSIKLYSNKKHYDNNEELHQMYEEAIYTMFQNNYDEAAKIFQQILRIRPDNKAARIRLQECLEVISNA